MKLVQSLVVAALVAVPALSFAQSGVQNAPVTRAEVKAELVQLQQAGYNPASDNTQYPANLQAALARVSAANGETASSYGGVTQGASAAGSRAPRVQLNAPVNGPDADVPGLGPIYAHS
ncbi:DUF4148 domain-containing protein [Paraburkholderia tropica]|uniref:Uncharacterized protein DUF4148 n=1 Tax=Paraburkholderia tropica TaxID=92647 RepID=A0ABX5MTY3_9BURK|nr:DUF4148 domain-containing protein [Paraburkholderia tropica]MBB3001140.1 hypothetical protein [Paraburkholderia tropica]MBB6320772.1 hypothetical protein [Paraburkholderia tropica]MDE1140781.1 DUF4148 domain-containing protein [Paraburkholderia tropica]PXX19067.1 uncharacterized protein DUF4148 [Paraburkholderia tropica]PZW88090.1 uncharacterized protein DUF4148 [Paraburkholderia tropica]